MSDMEYWAREDGEDMANRLEEYHGDWAVWSTNPIIQAWVRNTIQYYSPVLEPTSWETSLVFDGEQGELIKMVVPQARSLIRELKSIITKVPLNFQAIAHVQKRAVVDAMRIANGLASQIVDEEGMQEKGALALEDALYLGCGYLYPHWRTDKGNPYESTNDQLLYDGDLVISTPSVYDVFFDYMIESFEDREWVEIRTLKNRWNLIAQFPDLKDEIMALPSTKEWRGPHHSEFMSASENDYVYVYDFYHKPTPALPRGRMMFYSNSKTIYYDGDNAYDCIPLVEMKPESIKGMGFGYPKFCDLLPSQEMLDHGFSAVATNEAATAVQNITVPTSSNISVEDIGGMNWIAYTPQNVPGGGKPEALQLNASSPNTFKFMEILGGQMEQLSKVNSALRGTPPPGVTSGVAIATLTTTALEFINEYAQCYQTAMKRAMSLSIDCYRRFAKTKHIVQIVGPSGKKFSREFVGKDIDPIRGVKLVTQNVLMQTVAGRTEVAQQLVTSGLVTSVREYVSVLDGEPLSQLMETELSENDLIQAENEKLQEGEDARALSADDHALHIRKHKTLLNDTEIRDNDAIVARVLAHIEEHFRLAKDTDPMLYSMLQTGMQPQQPQGAAPPPTPQELPPAPGIEQEPPLEMGLQAPLAGMEAQPAQDMLERM